MTEKNKWDSISIDIETLGNKPGAIIASIGLSAFNQGGGDLGPELALYPSLTEQERKGLRIDVGTFQWWLRQEPEAQVEVLLPEEKRGLMADVVRKMTQFIDENLDYGGTVWVKGPSFDFSLMRAAFTAFGFDDPWDFRAERDVRTCTHYFPDMYIVRYTTDIPHTAVGDARHQARVVQHAHKNLEMFRAAMTEVHGKSQPQMS